MRTIDAIENIEIGYWQQVGVLLADNVLNDNHAALLVKDCGEVWLLAAADVDTYSLTVELLTIVRTLRDLDNDNAIILLPLSVSPMSEWVWCKGACVFSPTSAAGRWKVGPDMELCYENSVYTLKHVRADVSWRGIQLSQAVAAQITSVIDSNVSPTMQFSEARHRRYVPASIYAAVQTRHTLYLTLAGFVVAVIAVIVAIVKN